LRFFDCYEYTSGYVGFEVNMEIEHETGKKGAHTGSEALYRKVRKILESPDVDSALFTGQRSFDERMQDLGVQEKEGVIKWRSVFSKFMMRFLKVQYGVIIFFLFLQGFGVRGFYLDNYIFYILIAGTLVQSYFLIRIIFQYLFSPKK